MSKLTILHRGAHGHTESIARGPLAGTHDGDNVEAAFVIRRWRPVACRRRHDRQDVWPPRR